MMRMLRPGSSTRPAGESPAWVGTGAPSSRPRLEGETPKAERGVESLRGGSKSAARSGSESCSLDRCTKGEPSRSYHGEGHVRRTLSGVTVSRVSPGYGERDGVSWKLWWTSR